MKFKSLAIACALACTSQAYALTPATTPDVTLFISGSSALQNMIGQVSKAMFQNGSTAATQTDVYFDGTTSAASGSNFRAYFGLMKTDSSIPSSLQGKKVLIYETAKGGSIMGVNPVALGTNVQSIDMTTCAFPTTAKVDSATGISVYSCTGALNRVPDAGISDVEPADLEAVVNLPAGSSALTTTQLGGLNQAGVLAQAMGLVVNGSVAQGSTKPATTAMLNNMTKPQIAALLTGTTLDWNTVDSSVTAGSTSIVICRRQAGSGTQAGINAHILGAPCMTGNLGPATYGQTTATLGSTTPVAAGNVVVVENSSSGNVASCMGYAQTGTGSQAIALNGGGLVAAGTANSVVLPANNYAIGVMGLDRPAKTGELYQFASIDGNAATLANASTGKYGVLVESTFNNLPSLSGTKLALFTLFAAKAGDPAVLGDPANTIPGVLALSENGWAASDPFDATNPVMRVGNFGNTCQPLQQLQ